MWFRLLGSGTQDIAGINVIFRVADMVSVQHRNRVRRAENSIWKSHFPSGGRITLPALVLCLDN